MLQNERKRKFERHDVGQYCPAPLTPEGLRWAVNNLPESELPGFLRSYIRDRTPFAFQDEPLLWESLREWLATRLNIYAGSIGLNGSGQTGFSMSPHKFGSKFTKNSDLDLFVVDENLFNSMVVEVRQFCSQTTSNELYLENQKVLDRTVGRGFLDTNKVPSNHDKYPKLANINNLISILIDKLALEEFELKRSHVRVYSNWISYSSQMKLNLASFRNNI